MKKNAPEGYISSLDSFFELLWMVLSVFGSADKQLRNWDILKYLIYSLSIDFSTSYYSASVVWGSMSSLCKWKVAGSNPGGNYFFFFHFFISLYLYYEITIKIMYGYYHKFKFTFYYLHNKVVTTNYYVKSILKVILFQTEFLES